MYYITAQLKEKPARDLVYDTMWMPCYDIDFSISRFISYHRGFSINFNFIYLETWWQDKLYHTHQ